MTTLSIQPPYPILTDIDGQPLEDGYIWIGVANLPPIGNPISVYWDAALTQPAAQPIRTRGGYPVNAGTPARLYVGSDYSIQVQNKNGSVVYSAPAATERYSDPVITGISSAEVSFLQAGSGAVVRTAQSKMRDVVSVKDFGAVGDGVADDTVAFALALAAAQFVVAPPGTYKLSSLPNFTNGKHLIGAGRINTTLNYTGSGSFAVFNSNAGRCRMEGFTINGTGRTGTGITLGDITANAAFCQFRDLLVTNFNVGLRMGGGTWITFDTCEFGNPAGGLGVITNNVGIDFNYFGSGNYSSALAFYNCVISNNANAGVNASSVPVTMNEVQWINCNVQNNCQSATANPQFYMGSVASFLIDGMYMEYLFSGTKPDAMRVDNMNYGQIRSLYSNGAATAIIDRGGNSVNGVEILSPFLFNNSTAAVNMVVETDVTIRNGSLSGSVTLTGSGCTYLPSGSVIATIPQSSQPFTPVLTPDVSGSITQSGAGVYSRVGNVVFFNFRIDWSALSSPVGSVSVTGMPIAVNGSGAAFANGVGYAAGITIPAGSLTGYIPLGGTTMTIYNVQTTTAALNCSSLAATGVLIMSGSYHV